MPRHGSLSLRLLRVCLIVALITAWSKPSLAYLKFGYDVNGKSRTLRWTSSPVRYFVTDAGTDGVTATQFQAAVSKAFDTWGAVPTASVSFQFAGYTRNLPGEDDGRTTLGFVDEPDLDRVLASTSYLIDDVSGDLIEADIFFNSAFSWSVAAAGDHARWDLQSIATHEIGHLSGLGHSEIGETESTSTGRRVLSTGAVMFPIALGLGDISGRTLKADDIAGISDLYPDGNFSRTTGSLSGHVLKSGRGVYGAHVVAFDTRSGDMVGNFSLSTSGQFSIAGLRAGPYLLRVEPLDDADTDSFFDVTEPTDVNFRAKYYERLVIVPRGGDSGNVDVKVVAK